MDDQTRLKAEIHPAESHPAEAALNNACSEMESVVLPIRSSFNPYVESNHYP